MQIHVGDVGYRRPDGSVYRWAPICREVPEAEAPTIEEDTAKRAAQILAAKFAAYKSGTAKGGSL